MTVHGKSTIKIGDDVINTHTKVKLLGSYVTPQGESTTEIKIRLRQARKISESLSDIWKSRDICRKLKIKLAKALVWSIALYGCETWTLRKTEKNG